MCVYKIHDVNPMPFNFLVHKFDLKKTRLFESKLPALPDGSIELQIERFAFTANNITYAAFGDAMHYWHFYPVSHLSGLADAQNWGRIPVWGFASVTLSRFSGISTGARVYGYWPMSSHVQLLPTRVQDSGFSDGAQHRTALHTVYNQYQRCSKDPLFNAATQDLQAVLSPLFTTAWLIDHFLADQQFFGAHSAANHGKALVMLSSASSKTVMATAFCLAQRGEVEVVGFTSGANRTFCEGLGCYHRVLTYEALSTLDANRHCVYVDLAGNAALRVAIHTHFVNLKYNCSVGASHVNDLGAPGSAKNLPGPKATLFFAPAQGQKRGQEWGAEGLRARVRQTWDLFLQRVTDPSKPWLQMQHHHGPIGMGDAYAKVLSGQDLPSAGRVVVL